MPSGRLDQLSRLDVDADLFGLIDLWNVALHEDGQNAVDELCVLDFHVFRKAEHLRESALGDPLVDIGAGVLALRGLDGHHALFGLDADLVGDATNYLIDNMEVNVAFFRERPIGITLPNFVVLEVVEAPPGEKGNTVTGASKPVVVSTGYTVNAPMFVSEGELLKIDTRTGEYVERVKA